MSTETVLAVIAGVWIIYPNFVLPKWRYSTYFQWFYTRNEYFYVLVVVVVVVSVAVIIIAGASYMVYRRRSWLHHRRDFWLFWRSRNSFESHKRPWKRYMFMLKNKDNGSGSELYNSESVVVFMKICQTMKYIEP